jgi:hypothetical protein
MRYFEAASTIAAFRMREQYSGPLLPQRVESGG